MPRYDKVNAFLGENTQNNRPYPELKTVEATLWFSN